MPTTSIGNHGYSVLKEELTSTEITKIRRDLTVKPFTNTNYGNEAPPFPVYSESKRKLYLPRFYGIKEFGLPKSVKIDPGEDAPMNFTGKLKDKQLPIVKAFQDATRDRETGGGIISVPCGYGKTVLALYLAAQMGKKTLVIVHKEFLMNQWKERIEQFLPDVKVGKIQRNVINRDGCEIVIGLLQSISMIEYPDETFAGFGLVIYDECHHLGAEVFSRALMKTNTPFTLGLSATPNRQDGLTKVFCWYLGDIIFKITKREQETVDVMLYRYFHESPEYSKELCNVMQKPNLPLMINNICSFMPRVNLIVTLVMDCVLEGRKILLLSDRKNHLGILKEEFEKYRKFHTDFPIEYTVGYYLGGMKQEELEKTEKDTIILGTFAMASEGFDCREPLDTIVLASPKSNIEQAVGRILRQEARDRKFTPLVIDVIDEFSMFPKQGLKRIKFYQRNKYDMRTFDSNGKELETPKKTKKPKVAAQDLEFLADSD
jgi:superfamily II DNA or RNA helicase